jgi:hypothetical protein
VAAELFRENLHREFRVAGRRQIGGHTIYWLDSDAVVPVANLHRLVSSG